MNVTSMFVKYVPSRLQLLIIHPFQTFKRPSASPMSTSSIGENHLVRANTNTPWSSLMQTPTPTLSRKLEKETLTLPLNLLGDNLHHPATILSTWMAWIVLLTWALIHLVNKDEVLLQTILQVFVVSF